MRFLSLFLFLHIFFYEVKGQQQIVTKLKTFDFNIKAPEFKPSEGMASRILYGLYPPFYRIKETFHLVSVPLDFKNLPPIHFYNDNGTWKFENYYKDAAIYGLASVAPMDTIGTFVLGSTGNEYTVLGDLHVMTSKNDNKLSFKKLNSGLEYYGDVTTGDINNDGLNDVISYGGKFPKNLMTPFFQDSSGNFTVNADYFLGIELGNPLTPFEYAIPTTGYALAVANLFNKTSKFPTVVKGQYSSSKEGRYGLAFYNYDSTTKIYSKVHTLKELGVFKDTMMGSKTIRVVDVNKDSFLDLIVRFETPSGNVHGIQIFLNDKSDNFNAGQTITYYSENVDSHLNFNDVTTFDINNDGFEDIILSPAAGAGDDQPNFYIKNPPELYNVGQRWGGFNLKKFILINDQKGNFKMFEQDILFYNIVPYFFRALPSKNQIRYVGFTFPTKDGNPLFIRDASNNILKDSAGNFINPAPDSIRLIDVVVTFCNNLNKPTFNTNKFSFCNSDSIKLSITNVNKGDTLKWYFGNKSDLTNVSNKTFTDSSKVFVTRTDSLGCMISSDTFQLKKYAIPGSPSLVRDTANNLVASMNGITWYKDGVKIADTSQKFKPTSNGIYTATTTQNGCTSALSQGYYYLTNAVANLSNGEYFKISPNPTSGELNINYKISSSKNINISVFDINGRAVLLNKKVESGSKVNLGAISKGNYIIQVKDGAGRLISSQKLVKD